VALRILSVFFQCSSKSTCIRRPRLNSSIESRWKRCRTLSARFTSATATTARPPSRSGARALEKPLAGEFAFQCKFERLQEVHKSALKLSEEFYKTVQLDCVEWVKLGTTKTAMVYGLGSVPVKNHE
jgi:hypothetical protein